MTGHMYYPKSNSREDIEKFLEHYGRKGTKTCWCGESLFDGRSVCIYSKVPQHCECWRRGHRQFGPFRI